MSTPRGLGPADVLSPVEAARALRVREADGIAWLREKGLVRTLRLPGERKGAAVERVIWGDVLDLLRAGEPVTTTPTPVARPVLRRAQTL